MKYRIQYRESKFWPEYRQFIRWKPLVNLMNLPASFGTYTGAETYIYRMHCNWMNNTANQKFRFGRSVTPRIKNG